MANIAVSLAIMGLRWFGLLQVWELKAFDFLRQNLPTEAADKRLLIVGADEGDLNQYGYPIPDRILVQLLDKLQQYRPAVIGLDIFRDRSIPENERNYYLTLLDRLQKNQNIVAVCAGNNLDNSVAPPSQISSKRIGFVDLFDDKQHTGEKQDIVRRYLLSRSPNAIATPSRCTTAYSFGWQLAYRYLKQQGISVTTAGEDWQFGNTIARRLQARSGGYQNLDARGNQLLIRYRNSDRISQTITIQDLLANNFPPEWIENRVVAIGITAASVPDIHDTPIGEMRGLLIHTHVVSQILSAVEDPNRPFFWWLPQWSDTILVFFWSLAGGVVVWRWQRILWRVIGLSISIVLLYSVCWFVFTKGGWLPFIPSLLALVVTPVVVSSYQWIIGNRE
jgi:CHASE2 domain-containing sensor protein